MRPVPAASRRIAGRGRSRGRGLKLTIARQRIKLRRPNAIPHLLQRLNEGPFAGGQVKMRRVGAQGMTTGRLSELFASGVR